MLGRSQLHNNQLYDLYYSSVIIWVAKSRRKKINSGFWWENLKKNDQWLDLDIAGL